jgi:ATP phosphoribosyltransferase
MNVNLKLAMQKKGRLTEKSLNLLKTCGIDVEMYSERLVITARNFDLDVLFLRDDDIPEYVQDGVADIGIVGENVLIEKNVDAEVVRKLGFGKCKLMIAIPEKEEISEIKELDGKRIATSYPVILQKFLEKNKITAKIIDISGSVEIAPTLGISDYICDLVSTGNTLKMNKLKKSFTVFESEAVLISNKNINPKSLRYKALQSLLQRIDSALNARNSKYIMMNIPKSSLDTIRNIVPALKSPTILPLADTNMLALHAVIPSDKFWEINDDLKKAGASGILVIPIENMIL